MVSRAWHLLLLFGVHTEALHRSNQKDKQRKIIAKLYSRTRLHTHALSPIIIIILRSGLSSLLGHGANACFSHWKGDSFCDKACNNADNDFDFGDCSRKAMRFQSVHGTELFQPSLNVETTQKPIELTQESKTKHHVDMFKNTTAKWTHVRRGQPFELKSDSLSSFFGSRSWTLRLQIKDQTPIDLKINSQYIVEKIPIYAAVGIYDVSFVDPKAQTYKGGQLVVLFNPYLEGTDVYGSPSLPEYIEEEVRNIPCVPLHLQNRAKSRIKAGCPGCSLFVSLIL